MKLAILGSTESWYVRDLRRAAAGRHEIVPVTFRDVTARINASRAPDAWSSRGALPAPGKSRVASRAAKSTAIDRPTVDLNDCDAVFVRTMPVGSLEQVVFRMDVLGQLEATGVAVINPPKAIEAAVDKYLTTARLAAAGLRVPRTYVCQSAEAAMAAYAELGGRVVVKPLFGGEGRGITRLDDEALALRALTMLEQLGAVLYVQEFIEHTGYDMRLLVIGGNVLGIRRRSSTDWRTNISRGARAEPLEVTPELAEFAHQGAEAVGAPLAGVDLLPGCDGKLYAIEVNAVPGWQALSRVLNVDVAAKVLKLLEVYP